MSVGCWALVSEVHSLTVLKMDDSIDVAGDRASQIDGIVSVVVVGQHFRVSHAPFFEIGEKRALYVKAPFSPLPLDDFEHAYSTDFHGCIHPATFGDQAADCESVVNFFYGKLVKRTSKTHILDI